MRTREKETERLGWRSVEKIYLEKEGERESFSLPARGMTHLLPADRRMDGDKEEWGVGGGGGGQSCEEERWKEERGAQA